VKTLPRKPSKRGIIQFAWFNLGGAAFFIVGYLLFVLLYGLFGWAWLPAKLLADLVGWSANFTIQYWLAFREEAQAHKAHSVAAKFTGFSLLNLAIDYAIVAGLNWLGVSPFIGLWVAAGFFTLWKWLWYKHVIFTKPKSMA